MSDPFVRRGTIGVALLMAAASTAFAQQTRLELVVSPAVDLHFFIKSLASNAKAAVSPELQTSVAACRKLGEALGPNLLAWGVVDGSLYGVSTVAEVRSRLEALPETHEVVGPGSRKMIALRALANEYGAALAEAENHFLVALWPDHRKLIEARRQDLERDLLSKQAECLEYMMSSLGIQDPKATVPVYLVTNAPFPGAFTFRSDAVPAVCFVSCTDDDHARSLLYEQVLHEATHALDVASGGESVFGQLRDRLSDAGLTPRDRPFRDVPHTVMFVQAGETIRRKIDPAHEHYGHAAGYYKKVPLAAAAVVDTWVAHLDGKLTRDEAVDKMVQATTNSPASGRGD